MAVRVKEAGKLGFGNAVTPVWRGGPAAGGVALREFAAVADLFTLFPAHRDDASRPVAL